MVHLSFPLSITGTYHLYFFLPGRLRGQSVLAVGSHSLVDKDENDALTASAWMVHVTNCYKIFSKKEQKQVSIKRFVKRHVGMV